MKKYLIATALTLIIILSGLALVNQVLAFEDFIGITIDEATILKGYTVEAFGGEMRIGITPGALTKETYIEFKRILNNIYSPPNDYNFASDILEFDIKTKENYDNKKPLWLQMSFETDYTNLNYDKVVYFYDEGLALWRELPSKADFEENFVRAAFHLPYAKLAVLEKSDFMSQGVASWYKYKDCDCAASPDFPKGTKLLVTNVDNGKSVVVTVNDWGPERDIFPDRVIDLDVTAFEKIANKKFGLAKVRVAPYIEELAAN